MAAGDKHNEDFADHALLLDDRLGELSLESPRHVRDLVQCGEPSVQIRGLFRVAS